MSRSVIALVGRPNVGKSTLFNRLIQKRMAIEEKTPGVTRDRLYGYSDWIGREFAVVDTGGLTFDDDRIAREIQHQVQIALEEAQVILFVVDVRTGPLALDFEVARALHKADKPVLVVANKADQPGLELDAAEFYKLGFGEPHPVSGAQGLGIGDLLDAVVALLPKEDTVKEEEHEETLVAVVGRPNVGKSSLVNHFIGRRRLIVSDMPGTTRDAIDTLIEREGKQYRIIDTAGIRRKNKVTEAVEYYSVLRAISAVESAEVVLFMLDAAEEITEQDKRIAGIAHEAGKGIIVVVNKWDKVERDEKTMDVFRAKIRNEFAYLSYAPIIFVSALTGQRTHKIFELIDFVVGQRSLRISTSRLNELLQDAVAVAPPPSKKGRGLKINYMTQAGVKPPTFVLFVNDPEIVHFSYLRYLENRLRDTYGFEGTPIRLFVRKKNKGDRK